VISKQAQRARDFYRGDIARDYDKERMRRSLWSFEDVAVRAMFLGRKNLRLLDVPVGTGRFLPLFEELGFTVTGLDSAPDMLTEAAKRGTNATLALGDAFALPFRDKSFDVAFCCRLFHLITHKDVPILLDELSRVASEVIFTVRMGTEKHPRHGPDRQKVLDAYLGELRYTRFELISDFWLYRIC
jgi:ubiquinone/menaquinone biosynthesis C-methylase UbiE